MEVVSQQVGDLSIVHQLQHRPQWQCQGLPPRYHGIQQKAVHCRQAITVLKQRYLTETQLSSSTSMLGQVLEENLPQRRQQSRQLTQVISLDRKMDCPLEIHCVGHGTEKGEYQATIPVALKIEDGSAVMFDYDVPLIGSHHGWAVKE